MPMVLSELAYSIQPDTVAESSIFSVFSPHDRIQSPVRGSIHADYSVRILFLSIAISGFLYTSFTNCSPPRGKNPVSLEHKEAAPRYAPRRTNSGLFNRHSSISPLFSLISTESRRQSFLPAAFAQFKISGPALDAVPSKDQTQTARCRPAARGSCFVCSYRSSRKYGMPRD